MATSEFWNKRYSEDEFAYGVAPNVFFAEQLANFPKGKMLLPAEGQGRNAVFASKMGWSVFAFDYSEVAKAKALQLAEQEGVSIEYAIMAYDDLTLEENEFDFAALIYAHPPVQIRRKMHQDVSKAVKPGGIILLEAFHKDQFGLASGGPKNLPMLYSEEELAGDFEGLEIITMQKETVILEEGPYHQGEAHVIRLVARKPEAQEG